MRVAIRSRRLPVGQSTLVVLAVALGACSSAPTSVPMAGAPAPRAPDLTPRVFDAAPVGWGSVPDLGTAAVTGGDGGELVEVSTTADFVAQADLAGPRIILVNGVIGDGTRVSIASDHTVIGLPGAEFHGGLKIDGVSNVVVRNLKIVGNNCTDSPTDCSGGFDAVSITDAAHHVWIDHCDISDGSDGNLDVNGGADYVTISWTKFSYSGLRAGGHQFSNLVGSSDNEPSDAGRLRVTYHHVWWADNIRERMPRVRYGQVHVFNSFYSAHGANYCIGVGVFANVLTEANVFLGVRDPIESNSYSNDQSVVVSRDNLYVGVSGVSADRGTEVFTPPYAYTLDAVRSVQAQVENGAGTCPSHFTFNAVPLTCSVPDQAAASAP